MTDEAVIAVVAIVGVAIVVVVLVVRSFMNAQRSIDRILAELDEPPPEDGRGPSERCDADADADADDEDDRGRAAG